MHDLVVHCKRAQYDVYIGRTSGFRAGFEDGYGNPFSHLQFSSSEVHVPTRSDAVSAYAAWLEGCDVYFCSDGSEIELTDFRPKQRAWILAHVRELRGKVLGCWCAPQACHGEVLVRLAN